MIATAIVRFIQIQINDSEMFLGSRFAALRAQKAILYSSKLVPDCPIKMANDLYTVFKIQPPISIKMEHGELYFPHPEVNKKLFKVPKKRASRKDKLNKEDVNTSAQVMDDNEQKKVCLENTPSN